MALLIFFMENTVNPFESLIAPILAAFPELEASDIVFNAAPKLELGDVAIPMFLPARKLKAAPPKLSAEFKEKVDFGDLVTEENPTGPYLNLKLNRPAFSKDIVTRILADGDRFGSNHSGAGLRMLIEHTSINPNASPHVGRARCAMIGDSLTRLFRFEDYEVDVHYYVNDMGRQIGLLAMIAEEIEDLTFDQILDAYVEANERAKVDEDFAEKGYALLSRMEEGDPEVQAMFRNITDLCLKGQLAVLARIGAQYDTFDRESKYVKDARLDALVAQLKEKDAVFVDEKERLVVDLSKLGHEYEEGRYFVLMRANGSSMYGYRDLAYSMDKNAMGADVNLMVLGEDHKLYAQQLKMMLEATGHDSAEAIYYSYILLKDGKMSTRQGTVVLLEDFLDQAAALAQERVAEQCKDMTPEEQLDIANQVAVAAIRFAILRVSPNKNVTFDMEAALSFQGDTGPYIQYSCARMHSILRKYDGELPAVPGDAFPVTEDAEWILLNKLATFPDIINSCVEQRTVSAIAIYALEVARAFTTFYHDCPVLTAETPELIEARALVCKATRQVLANALDLLGLDAPERM